MNDRLLFDPSSSRRLNSHFTLKDQEGLNVMRHSAAHVLAHLLDYIPM